LIKHITEIGIKRNFWGGGKGNFGFQISDFRFQISHLTFKLICINTSHFYATTLINHKQVWTQWKFDATLFWLDYLIRINLFDAVKTKKIYSEVEQLVRLFNAIKSTMKIQNIGGKKSEI